MQRTFPIAIVLIGILYISSFPLHAQNSYLTTVDNADCKFGIIKSFNFSDSLIYYNCHAYDKYHHRYFLNYTGLNTDIKHLITIDAKSGDVINDKSLNSIKKYQLFENICYDIQTDKLYGLLNDRVAMTSYFVSLDPASGDINVMSEINDVPNNQFFATINSANHTYIFISTQPYSPPLYETSNTKISNYSDTARIYTVDINSGSTISNKVLLAPSPSQFYAFTYLVYDSILNKYYSLFGDVPTSHEYLATVDPASGITTAVNPSNNFSYADAENRCYDEKDHSIIFTSYNQLFTVDVNSGTILNEPKFKTTPSFTASNYYAAPYDNYSYYGLEYDDSMRTPLALFYGHFVNTDEISFKAPFAFPNPFSSTTNVFLKNTYNEVNVVLFNSMGQRCQNINITNSSIFTINKNGLAPGDYFAQVQADSKNIGVVKLTIQ